MAKIKSPVLSLGATGTVADAITFTRRRHTNIAEKKPTPAYRFSLPQAYQRWDYQDGIAYWHALTNAQKQAYKTAGSRFHMPGFSYFMRYYLNNLPGILGRWRLDSLSGSLLLDTASNKNHMTNIGSIITTAVIGNGIFFDGLNDYAYRDNPKGLSSPTGSIAFWCSFHDLGTNRDLFLLEEITLSDFINIRRRANNKIWLTMEIDNVNVITSRADIAILDTDPHLFIVTQDGVAPKMYLDNVDCTVTPTSSGHWTSDLSLTLLRFGRSRWSWGNFTGDELTIYDHVLDAAARARMLERRYPL